MGKQSRVLLLMLSLLYLPLKTLSSNDLFVTCPIYGSFNLTGKDLEEFGIPGKFDHKLSSEANWDQNSETIGCKCYNKPCLRLCCPMGMYMSNRSCFKASYNASFPPVYSGNSTRFISTEVNVTDFHTIVSPCLYGVSLLTPDEYPEDQFYLSANGSVYLEAYKQFMLFHEYCWAIGNDSMETFLPAICMAPPDDEYDKNDKVEEISQWQSICNIVMLISVPFLLITCAVYLILPELRNLHGVTLASFGICLAIGFTTRYVNSNIKQISLSPRCIILCT